jgi:hypothetical protein
MKYVNAKRRADGLWDAWRVNARGERVGRKFSGYQTDDGAISAAMGDGSKKGAVVAGVVVLASAALWLLTRDSNS